MCARAHASTTSYVCTIGAWIYHFLELFIIILTIVRRNCLRWIRKWHRNDCALHSIQHMNALDMRLEENVIRNACAKILDLLVYLLDAISFESGNRQHKFTFFRSFHRIAETLIDLFRSPTMTSSLPFHDADNKYTYLHYAHAVLCSVNTRCNYLSHSTPQSSTEHCRSTLLYSTN